MEEQPFFLALTSNLPFNRVAGFLIIDSYEKSH